MWRRRSKVLVLIDLIQDADVLLPVLVDLARRSIPTTIIVSRWLATASPRIGLLLKRRRLAFTYRARSELVAGQEPNLSDVAAILLASESDQEAHSAGHALALRAAGAGIPCATLQHGLDMSGLTRDLEVRFASTTVLTWSANLTTDLAVETERKVLPVGRPMLPLLAGPLGSPGFGVFENLHWDRYSDDERRAFIDALEALARSRPDLPILARSHPAGAWLDGCEERLADLANVELMTSAASRSSSGSASDVLRRCSRVVTTPSTLALDAAQAGCAVALAIEGGPLFDPLPVLERSEDWLTFADADPVMLLNSARTFAARAVLEGNASDRIVDWLATLVAA